MSFATGATKTWFAPALGRGRPFLLGIALVGCFLLATGESSAAFIQPTNWTRPANTTQATSYRTTYQSYDVFTAAAGPNTPDVANINPNGTANAYDTSGGSFITSGGNIYSFSMPTLIESTVPNFGLGNGFVTNVLLQVRTLGSVLDTNSVKLIAYSGNAGNPYPTASAISANSQQLLLDQADTGGFGGEDQEWAFSFSIAGNAASYKLAFNAAASSMSLDRLSIDTQAARLPGDFNLDGHLNAADVLAASAALADLGRYQATNQLTPAEMLQIGNLNGDGTVTNADLQSLLNTLKQGHGSTSAVPEPNSAMLAAMAGGICWLVAQRRKLLRNAEESREATFAV